MNCQSNKYVNLVTLIVVFIIFIQMNFIILMLFKLNDNKFENTNESTTVSKENVYEIKEWNLKIPKINLSTNIKEGTSEEIINNNIGHFKETDYLEGNIGLIAGSNGYKENHFNKLEELQEDDVILYQYGDKEKQYRVIDNKIINQKDWSYLSKTKLNTITLITGVQNEPEKRRCVQAIEVI